MNDSPERSISNEPISPAFEKVGILGGGGGTKGPKTSRLILDLVLVFSGTLVFTADAGFAVVAAFAGVELRVED